MSRKGKQSGTVLRVPRRKVETMHSISNVIRNASEQRRKSFGLHFVENDGYYGSKFQPKSDKNQNTSLDNRLTMGPWVHVKTLFATSGEPDMTSFCHKTTERQLQKEIGATN